MLCRLPKTFRTGPDKWNADKEQANLTLFQKAVLAFGIRSEWKSDSSGKIHAGDTVTDTGGKIALDRGLDISQRFEMNEAFSLKNWLQQFRPVKEFEVTYLRTAH